MTPRVLQVVSRFMSNSGEAHWAKVKCILRYLRGTSKMCLCFGNGDHVLQGYTNTDYARDKDSRKFTPGYLVTFAGGRSVMEIKAAEVHLINNNRSRVHSSG